MSASNESVSRFLRACLKSGSRGKEALTEPRMRSAGATASSLPGSGSPKRQRTAALQKLAHIPMHPDCALRPGVRQSSAAFDGSAKSTAGVGTLPTPAVTAKFRRLYSALLVFSLVFFIAGCRTTPAPKLVMTGDLSVDGPNAIANGPPRDKVLWQYRTASAALRQGNFDQARQLSRRSAALDSERLREG